MQFVNGTATLTVPQASVENSGNYQLTASNIEGEVNSNCYVTVQEPKPSGHPPSFQLHLKDVSVFEKQEIRLDCIISAQPEPEVVWLHNDNPLKESKDINLLFHGDHCTLHIKEALREDSGVYKVVALNSAGEASSECTATVTPLNKIETAIEFSEINKEKSYMPPKFDKLLDDAFVIEGESCELECSLESGPLPEIQWFLNNKEIAYDDHFHAETRDDGRIKLVITSARPSDKGVYTVKATNSTGVAKCFSHLIVKASSKGGVDVATKAVEDKLVCPKFKQLFADQCVGKLGNFVDILNGNRI